MRSIMIAIALAAPQPAGTQPFSDSMVDCAALYQNAAQWVSTDDKADTLMWISRKWAAAAEEQAAREGRALSMQQLWAKIDDKTAAWEAKGGGVFLTEEFRDWMQYCRKFGEAQGLDLNL